MFPKSGFSATPASTNFGFDAANVKASPFGQSSSIFAKPSISFGNANPTFGNSPPIFGPSTNTLFPSNTPSSFGANQNVPAFNVPFGNQQNSSTNNLFGVNASAFGQQNKSFGFGSTISPNRIFGQTSAQPAPFQTTTSSSLFGGNTSFGNASSGTTVKFNPVTGTDTMQKSGIATNINTKHHCITCMKEYEGKSLEELRWEDYQANRKGPQQQTGFGVIPFGTSSASTAPPLFGQTTDNKSNFGQTGGFSQSPGFGIGNQTGQTSGLFGKPNTSFGTTTTPSSFAFNNSATVNPFSSQSKTLFGNTNTSSSGFGGSNIFGQSTAQPTQSNMFGQSQNTGFGLGTSFGGVQQNQTTGLFQTSKPASFGPFSQPVTSAAGFGQQSGTFGQSNAFSGFAKPTQPTFGNTQPNFGTGLGNQNNGNLFGNMQQKPGGFFGGSNTSGIFSFVPNTGFNLQPTQAQPQTFQTVNDQYGELKAQLQSADIFGRNKILTGLTPLKDEENKRTTNPRELKKILDNSMKVKISSPVANRPNLTRANTLKLDLFDGALKKTDFDNDNFIKMAGKRLIIRKKEDFNTPSNICACTSFFDFEDDENKNNSDTDSLTSKNLSELSPKSLESAEISANNLNGKEDDSADLLWLNTSNLSVNNDESISPRKNDFKSDDNTTNLSLLNNSENIHEKRKNSDESPKHPCGIILTRPEYYTIPPLNELSKFFKDDGTCFVKGITIGRVGYGNVYFPDLIDIANLNLDKIIFFRQGEIIIYPDESTAPPVGQGLNRRAQVTLDNVWPKTKDGSIVLTDLKDINAVNFIDKLQQICERRKSKFVEYRPETGSWVFKVDHFSKHGLSDSDEEDVSEKVITLRNKNRTPAARNSIIHGMFSHNGYFSNSLDKEKECENSKEFSRQLDWISDDEDIFKDGLFLTSTEIDLLHEMSDSMELSGLQKSFRKSSSSISSDESFVQEDIEFLISFKSARNFIYKQIDPAQISLMKYSFFGSEVDEEITTDIDSSFEWPLKNLESNKSMENENPSHPLMPKPVELLNNNFLLSSEELLLNNYRNYKDLSLFMGRSFRSGWKNENLFIELTPAANHKINISHIKSYIDSNLFFNTLIGHLEIFKSNSKLELNSSNCPTLIVNLGFDSLYENQKLAQSSYSSNSTNFYYSCIWNLIVALWTPFVNTTRRNIFGNWLKTTVTNEIEKDIKSTKQESSSDIKKIANKIFTYLSGNRIEEAAELAINNNLPQLSLLISQLNTITNVASFSNEQFIEWTESGAAKYIDNELLKIYMLQSGICVHEDVNVCENLDWKRALGIHLWYVVPTGKSVSTVLKTYKKAFTELDYSKKPFPPHGNTVNNYSSDDKFDVIYHIIDLFVNPQKSLNHVLETINYSTDPLDYSLCWLLLKTFESLEVGTMAQSVSDYIHINFANQLESLGYWKWAIFVLLFLKENHLKKYLITNILEHLFSDSNEDNSDTEEFLINEFSIPHDWIQNSKNNKSLNG